MRTFILLLKIAAIFAALVILIEIFTFLGWIGIIALGIAIFLGVGSNTQK